MGDGNMFYKRGRHHAMHWPERGSCGHRHPWIALGGNTACFNHMLFSRLGASTIANSRRSVLLLGPCQTGKSTLMRSLKPDLEIDLAHDAVFLEFAQNPRALEERGEVGGAAAEAHYAVHTPAAIAAEGLGNRARWQRGPGCRRWLECGAGQAPAWTPDASDRGFGSEPSDQGDRAGQQRRHQCPEL